MQGDLVLLTGATGHVGFHVLIQALDAGYEVRAVVRNKAKEQALLQTAPLKLRERTSRLSFAYVPDMTEPGAYDEAVKGVKAIIHVASPTPSSNTPSGLQVDIVAPAVKGTLGILESARKEPNVRRVVVTSSIVAIMPFKDFVKGSDTLFGADDRQPTPDSSDLSTISEAYVASKTQALNDAEEWVRREEPTFDVIHILPSVVLGRDELQTSRGHLRVYGTNRHIIGVATGAVSNVAICSATVHVVDVARIHVAALAPRIPGNMSYIVSSNPAGTYSGSDFAGVSSLVAQWFPEDLASGVLSSSGKKPVVRVRINARKTEEVFGFLHLSFEEQVKDVVSHYLELDSDS